MTTLATASPKAPESASLVRCLLRGARYLRPYRTLTLVSAAMVVLSSLIGLLAPWPLQILVDSVLGTHPLPGVLAPALAPIADNRFALLILVVASGFAITLLTNGLTVLDHYVNTDMRPTMWRRTARPARSCGVRLMTGRSLQPNSSRPSCGVSAWSTDGRITRRMRATAIWA